MIIFPFFFSQDMYKNICQEAAIDKADDREDGKDMCDVAERLEQRGIQRGVEQGIDHAGNEPTWNNSRNIKKRNIEVIE